MSTEANNATLTEKILAFSALTIIAVSILSFFATLIAAFFGIGRELMVEGLWPFVTWLGYVGVPIGFALIVTLIILTRRRRKREFLNEQR